MTKRIAEILEIIESEDAAAKRQERLMQLNHFEVVRIWELLQRK